MTLKSAVDLINSVRLDQLYFRFFPKKLAQFFYVANKNINLGVVRLCHSC